MVTRFCKDASMAILAYNVLGLLCTNIDRNVQLLYNGQSSSCCKRDVNVAYPTSSTRGVLLVFKRSHAAATPPKFFPCRRDQPVHTPPRRTVTASFRATSGSSKVVVSRVHVHWQLLERLSTGAGPRAYANATPCHTRELQNRCRHRNR